MQHIFQEISSNFSHNHNILFQLLTEHVISHNKQRNYYAYAQEYIVHYKQCNYHAYSNPEEYKTKQSAHIYTSLTCMLYHMRIFSGYEKLLCCIFYCGINIRISYNFFILTFEFINDIRNHIKNLSYSILILNINKLGCTILNN